jgi:hypothetical protein
MNTDSKKTEAEQCTIPSVRCSTDFSEHPNDFEHKCCFKDQIEEIGRGTKYGSGELVEVDMQSGKTAIYQLFSERYNPVFTDTGQRNWKYHFVKYK